MKLPQKLFLLLFVTCLTDLLCHVDARGGKRNNKSRCKYKNKGIDGPCNSATNTKQVTLKVKGRRSGPDCAPTSEVTMPCDDFSISKGARRNKKQKTGKLRCKYDKKSRQVSDCDPDTNTVTITIPLKKFQDPQCDPVRTKVKPCRKAAGRRRSNGCVYDKQAWSECDVETNTRQREMVLVQGDATQCLPKKIVTKKCRKACRFIKGEWSPCNTTSGMKERTLTPKPGSAEQCEATVQSRKCQKLAETTGAKVNKCKYNFGELSPCDVRTNTMTQMMTLKSGDPNVCIRQKKLTRKCKIACKFRRGEWSECDEKTELTTRVDTLVKGDKRECEPTREMTKKCRLACKYTYGDWGDCDMKTNTRTRVKTLVKGDPEKCKSEENVSKPCTKRDGEQRCFFGSWGDFGPCTNGVMTKQRPLLQGGIECERKAVITKACES